MKIGAVVLNYKTYNDTIECVNSILRQTYKNYEIIIVENGSGNESYKTLKENFGDIERITVIDNDQNLGFARGNNLGINYARKLLKCDYVFVVNSDIVLNKDVFSDIIQVDIDGLGVLSPTVYNVDDTYQIPAIDTENL